MIFAFVRSWYEVIKVSGLRLQPRLLPTIMAIKDGRRVSFADEQKPRKKRLILNAFVEMCEVQCQVSHHQRIIWLTHFPGSGHQSPGLWKHPSDHSKDFNSVQHWISLAQTLERGLFQGMFIADVLGGYDVYGGPRNLAPAIKSGAQWPVNEPLSLVPAMAAATESLGFGVTVSSSYEQPYHLARRLSTVDHLSGGRWVQLSASILIMSI